MKAINQSHKIHQLMIATVTVVCIVTSISNSQASTNFSVDEDVMTSSFFQGANSVRGYAGEGRNVFRVSSNNPFGSPGAETIYLNFNNADFSSFSGAVHAELTMQSVAGGFGADAEASNPFTVSVHAVNADPLVDITDDTNPDGDINWLDFYNNNIETADAAALTSVDSFGSITFDVSSIVNDWASGSNIIQSIALTGLNDLSGNDFLHGFLNNSENPGSTYLTVSAVPIPSAIWLMGSGLIGFMGMFKKRPMLRKANA